MRRTAGNLCVSAAIGLCAIGIAEATVLLPADLTDLTVAAQAIVHGRVVDVRAEWVDGRRRIDSFVTIEADAYFKGDLGRRVTVRVAGGTFGRYRTVIVGAPVLTLGDEIVLFLGARGPTFPYVLGLSQGLFRVVSDPTSGRKLVTPPALVADGDAPERVVRGDPRRRPTALEEFGARVQHILAMRIAGTLAR